MKIQYLSIIIGIFCLVLILPSSLGYATSYGGYRLGSISAQIPFMKSNSNGTIAINYIVNYPHNSTMNTKFALYHSNLQDLQSLTSNDLTIKAKPETINLLENNTVEYTVTAKNNIKGVYTIAGPQCFRYPLVVGLNETEIPSSTLFGLSMPIHCYEIPSDAPQIKIINYDGMILKNVTRTPDQFSPMEQIQLGSNSTDVQCKHGFDLIIETHDNMPACVKPETAQILIMRGWAEDNQILLDAPAYKQMPTLSLYTNATVIHSGQAIGITISLDNPNSKPISMDTKDDWPIQGLDLGDCSNLPFGVAIMEGYYTEQNMTKGHPMFLHSFSPCPPEQPIKNFTFQPQSSNVTTRCQPQDLAPCRAVTQTKTSVAYKTFLDNGTFANFKDDIYTIVGGDEWGNVAIEHFAMLSNDTTFAGDLGSMSCPVMVGSTSSLGGVEFSASIKNYTGFVNDYNSKQYGNVFFLHKGSTGTINVQYNAPDNASWFQNNNNEPFNLTNGAALYYMADATIGKTIVPFAISLYSDETGYHHSQICHYGEQYGGGFAEPCNEDNKGNIPTDELPYASKLLKTGIVTSFEPNSVILYPNSNPVFTATVSTSSDAKTGTYMLSLERNLCGPGVLARLVVIS